MSILHQEDPADAWRKGVENFQASPLAKGKFVLKTASIAILGSAFGGLTALAAAATYVSGRVGFPMYKASYKSDHIVDRVALGMFSIPVLAAFGLSVLATGYTVSKAVSLPKESAISIAIQKAKNEMALGKAPNACESYQPFSPWGVGKLFGQKSNIICVNLENIPSGLLASIDDNGGKAELKEYSYLQRPMKSYCSRFDKRHHRCES